MKKTRLWSSSKKWGLHLSIFWSSSTNLWFNNLAPGGCCKSCISLAHPYCCFMLQCLQVFWDSQLLQLSHTKQSSCIIFESLFLRSTESSLITVTAVKFIHCVISFEVKTYSRFWKAILPKSWSQWNLLPSFHGFKSPWHVFFRMFHMFCGRIESLAFWEAKDIISGEQSANLAWLGENPTHLR